MPVLSEDMTEGTILGWKKQEGERIAKGETICEIEVEKSVFPIEAESDCILNTICVTEGECVPVGTVIAKIQELT
jgi:pyruvate/2-oxoglutarate dehydrogenase complex dihydrolipoamide acyltransferase (E2) component